MQKVEIIRIDDGTGEHLPALGHGLWLTHLDSPKVTEMLASSLAPAHLDILVDLRGNEALMYERLQIALRLCAARSIEAWLYVVVPDAKLDHALESLAHELDRAAMTPSGMLIMPAAYLKSYQPDGSWPDGPSPADALAKGRQLFPHIALGGGTPTYFTELNRCRPDPETIDFITHATSPIVHAADDSSVMQTLESLPHIFNSCRALVPKGMYRITTSAIGAWTNPYGARLTPNDGLKRTTLSDQDPRQRGLFAAAWNVGYCARAARSSVDALTLSSLGAPFHVTERHSPFPIFHVLRGMNRGSRQPRWEITTSSDMAFEGLGWQIAESKGEVWLANLGTTPLHISFENARIIQSVFLDEDTLLSTTTSFETMEFTGEHVQSEPLLLKGFAVARLVIALDT